MREEREWSMQREREREGDMRTKRVRGKGNKEGEWNITMKVQKVEITAVMKMVSNTQEIMFTAI